MGATSSLGQRCPSASPPWAASYHPPAHQGEGSLNSPRAAWAARMRKGRAAMEVFIFLGHRRWTSLRTLGSLSDFPGSQLCPCIYRKRRSGKSQGRDQNAFLGCIIDNMLFLNKGKEAEKATGRRGEDDMRLSQLPTGHRQREEPVYEGSFF